MYIYIYIYFFFEKEIYFVLLLRMCGTTKYKFVLFLQIKLIVYYISKEIKLGQELA